MHTIEKDLTALLELQEIDKQIESILNLRGELPKEIQKLEDSFGGLTSQAKACDVGIVDAEKMIATLRMQIKELESSVIRYQEQQMQIRNSREYDAITKELELHQLDIQLAEKKIKTNYDLIAKLKKDRSEMQLQIDAISASLNLKKEQLDSIIGDSQTEQEQLAKKRNKKQSSIEPDLVQQYESIRAHMPNKLGVVKVRDGACEGCFTMVYPQLQADIQDKIEIFCCEHCGRILGDVTNVTILDLEEEMAEALAE